MMQSPIILCEPLTKNINSANRKSNQQKTLRNFINNQTYTNTKLQSNFTIKKLNILKQSDLPQIIKRSNFQSSNDKRIAQKIFEPFLTHSTCFTIKQQKLQKEQECTKSNVGNSFKHQKAVDPIILEQVLTSECDSELKDWKNQMKNYLHASQNQIPKETSSSKQKKNNFIFIQNQKQYIQTASHPSSVLGKLKIKAKLKKVKSEQKPLKCSPILIQPEKIFQELTKYSNQKLFSESKSLFYANRKENGIAAVRKINKYSDSRNNREDYIENEQSLKRLAYYAVLEPYLGTQKVRVGANSQRGRNWIAIEQQIKQKFRATQRERFLSKNQKKDRTEKEEQVCGWQTRQLYHH